MEGVCGQPWESDFPKAGWSTGTQNICAEFFHYWVNSRLDYQTNHMVKESVYAGSYSSDVHNGYCDGCGQAYYLLTLSDYEPKLEICEMGNYLGCEPTDDSNSVVTAGGAQLNLQVLSAARRQGID